MSQARIFRRQFCNSSAREPRSARANMSSRSVPRQSGLSMTASHGDGYLSQRIKFALWNFARRHPLPGAAIRAAGRLAMGDAEEALRGQIGAKLDGVIPA